MNTTPKKARSTFNRGENDVEKVKKLKTNLAHGSRNDQHGQSGKTRKLLNEINEK